MSLSNAGSLSAADSALNSELRGFSRAVLLRALAEEKGFVRVHAAEALIAVGESTAPREAFTRELAVWEPAPERTGAWRVLAASARTPAERAPFVAKIESVLVADGAPDRLQSLESLCKLKVVESGVPLARARAMSAGPEAEQPLGLWALFLAGEREATTRLAGLLTSGDPVVRLRASYALRWLRPSEPAILRAVATAVDREPTDSLAYPYLLSAALVLNADASRRSAWKAAADKIVSSGVTGARYELCQAFVFCPEPVDAAVIAPLLDHKDGDARIGAAWLILAKAGAK